MPEEAGFSSKKLEEAEKYWESTRSAAFMVIYDGAVLLAWGDVERRFMLHSVRKSLMSALYGIHVDNGRIDLDKTMGEIGIDDTNPSLDSAEKKARIIDLIRARSGVFHAAAAEPPQNKKPPRGSHEPGTFWCYNNWDFNALGTILEQEAEIAIFEEFNRCFALPLGMQDFRVRDGFYMYEKEKSIHPAYHFRMSARDMARFGLLYLEEGNWKGKRILSQDWIRTSTQVHSPDAWGIGYGYMWWVNTHEPLVEFGMYSALGVGEQSIDVLPEANMVFVLRTNTFAGDKVSYKERHKLITMITAARIAEPKPNPRLEPLTSAKPSIKTANLSTQYKNALCGDYEIPSFGATGRLFLDGNDLVLEMYIGTFGLIPISKTRFMLEDVGDDFFLEKGDGSSRGRLYTESDLVMMGYGHLQKDETDQAIEIFKKAVNCFPDSFNTHDSLGEAYAKKGLIRKAIESYRKSIELNPDNANGIEMLEQLKKRG